MNNNLLISPPVSYSYLNFQMPLNQLSEGRANFGDILGDMFISHILTEKNISQIVATKQYIYLTSIANIALSRYTVRMNTYELTLQDRVLVLGGTGFVGKWLIPELVKKNIKLRLLVRDPAKTENLIVKDADIDVVKGDVLGPQGLEEALRGIHTAYYLVHSMGGKTFFKNEEYAKKDRIAAKNFMAAAPRSHTSFHRTSPQTRCCVPPSSSALTEHPMKSCAILSSACQS